MLSYPDRRFGWYRPALEAGEKALTETRFDLLVATSPPRVGALIAHELSRRHQVPWVMDLRDPWQMHWEGSGTANPLVRALLDRSFRRCVDSARMIVHNTERLRLFTSRLMPGAAQKTACVPNGYEPEWAQAIDTPARSFFGIGYYGNVLGNRSCSAFLDGLRRWIDAGRCAADRIRVRFVGGGFEQVVAQVAALGLGDIVEIHPTVPRAQIPPLMTDDFVLLLVANDQPVQVPGKAYDYLASGRRILALTERDGATADLLLPLEGCVVADRPAEVASALDSFYADFATGASARIERSAFLAEASYPRRIAVFADLLRSILARRPPAHSPAA